MPWEVKGHPTTPLREAGHPIKATGKLLLIREVAEACSLQAKL